MGGGHPVIPFAAEGGYLQVIDWLCQRWGQPPSVIEREDASMIFQLVRHLGQGDQLANEAADLGGPLDGIEMVTLGG